MQTQNNTEKRIEDLKYLAGSIAHENRNSLSAIQGACEVVKDNLTQAMEFLDLISLSSVRGLSMVDLTLQNINESEINQDNFIDLSITKIIKSVIKEYAFESEAEKELVNVNLENDFIFKGDETLMIFVLFNLLKNSLYYKARIDIKLEPNKTNIEGKTFNYLYFKDYGIGIDPDKLPHIFDSFFTSNKKGGTGLGLPFCKRVMKAFGGNIFCKSVKDEFTEFILKF